MYCCHVTAISVVALCNYCNIKSAVPLLSLYYNYECPRQTLAIGIIAGFTFRTMLPIVEFVSQGNPKNIKVFKDVSPTKDSFLGVPKRAVCLQNEGSN